jgi:ABC-type antimicrobial peptide transport system permease subunit
MFKNYLKITLRSLMKSKVFVLINVMGMGIALACCVVAYLNYDYNYSYDEQHQNVESVYRINFIREFQKNSSKNGITPSPMVMSLKENLTEADHFIRYIPNGTNVRIGDELFRTTIAYTDPALLEVFTFPIISGSAKELQNKGKILISDELAAKYFGDEDPLGKQITQPYSGGTKEYIIGGVFEKMVQNSSFQFDALTFYDNYYDVNPDADETSWRSYATVLLNIKNESRIPIITEQLQSHIEAQNLARDDFKITRFYLDPFVGMAVRAEQEQIRNHWFRQSVPTAAVIGPTIMAVLLLLIACFNFTNTSIAISSKRIKEIGIRKVMGGMRKHLILQFLGENVLLCMMALVAGLIMAEFLVPAYNQLWDFVLLDLSYAKNLNLILFLFTLLIVTGLIAGSYPAFYITKFEPTDILKGTFKIGGTSFVSRVLLTFQFKFTLGAVIMGGAFVQNARYQEALDVGFDKKGVIYSRLDNEGEYQTYRNSLTSENKITSMAGSKDQIFSSYYNDPIRYEDLEQEVDILDVGDEYISTMGMTLLEGRDFNRDSETDRKEAAIVNEEFVKNYGWEDPIGKRVVWMDTVQLYIVGVVKDFYTGGFWSPLQPTMLRYTSSDLYTHLIVSAEAKDILAVNEQMETKWKELFPNKRYNGNSLDENMVEALEVNANIVTMFVFLGVIAILLSISGLYTLVSLNLIKRMKEIGVRRVLGASIGNVTRIVNKEFVIILSIAAVLGSVFSYYGTDLLMGSIWTYYMEVGVLTFLIPISFIFIVSGVVVVTKAFKAAITNPALILRDE